MQQALGGVPLVLGDTVKGIRHGMCRGDTLFSIDLLLFTHLHGRRSVVS
jgi:hypothetical protein